MGPKKRKQPSSSTPSGKKPRGILGVAAGYNSDSDEDYLPASRPVRSSEQQRSSPHKGRQKRTGASGARASRDDDSVTPDSVCESSDSDETPAARKHRRAQPAVAQLDSRRRDNSTGSTKGRGQPSNRRRTVAAPASATHRISSWDQLPTAVLAQVFTAVCRQGALPMAPRLACVCTSWQAAVAATPELWRILDTAAIPARAWSQPSRSVTSSSRGKAKARASSSGKARAKDSAAVSVKGAPTAVEAGLAAWVASGRLQQLQSLLLRGEGSGRSFADVAEGCAAAGAGANRQLSAGLLLQIAQGCQQLRRVSLAGIFGWQPQELTSVLLSMPALTELWVCGVRLSSLTGLSTSLTSVLEAAAATGRPALRQLVIEGCLSLSQKPVNALFTPRQQDTPENEQQQEQANGSDSDEAPSPPHHQVASPRPAHGHSQTGPAFPQLEVLDLSGSGHLCASTFKLQLDSMQAAMPRLRVLKLSGLGGLYGWMLIVRHPAALPGFPALESLHVDCAVSAPLSYGGGLQLYNGSSSINDTALLQLAGKSVKLTVLDLSGAHVTPDGLRQLAAAHAACRAEAGAVRGGTAAGGAAAAPTSSAEGRAADASGGAAARGALRIKDLQLDNSSLATDDGLVAVGECCCDTLEQVVVRNAGARLGDRGIRGLLGCLHLSTLDITGCSVTEEGLSDLLSALPDGVLEELHLGSCRSISRGARMAAARGVAELQKYLADAAG